MSGPSQFTTPAKAAPPVQPLSGLGRILSTPESKRRPAKLTLRTSNLTPPRTPTRGGAKPPLPLLENESVDVVSHLSTRAHVGLSSDKQDPERRSIDSNHTITERNAAVRRVESDQTLRPARPERPRSSSYGDIQSMKEALALDQPSTVVVPVLPIMPLGSSAQMPSKSSRTLSSPDKTTAATLSSVAPSSPAHTLRPPPSQPFDTISLPWGMSSTIALSQELGPRFDELIAFTLKRLPPAPPRVLRPSVLKTSANEDRRLRVELGRLRAKYDSITHHRDGLIASLGVSDVLSDPSKLRKTIESMRKAVTRCDRIARQIFICNDQIRQIEVQGEAHVVGILRVALDRAQEAARSRVSSLSGTSGSEAESDGATSCETSETGHELSHVNIRRVTFVQTPQPRRGSGVDEGDRSRALQVAQNEANRLSVATIISLNQLGFPIPPDRDIESPSETRCPCRSRARSSRASYRLGPGASPQHFARGGSRVRVRQAGRRARRSGQQRRASSTLHGTIRLFVSASNPRRSGGRDRDLPAQPPSILLLACAEHPQRTGPAPHALERQVRMRAARDQISSEVVTRHDVATPRQGLHEGAKQGDRWQVGEPQSAAQAERYDQEGEAGTRKPAGHGECGIGIR